MLYPLNLRNIPPGVLRVNPLAPIARGLIACWVPGRSPVDISGSAVKGANLTYQSASTGFGESSEGAGVTHTGTGSGLVTPFLTSGSPFFFTTAITIYWRGRQLSAPSAFADFFAVIQNNTDTTPFYIAGIRANSTVYEIDWNSAGNFTGATPGSVSPATTGINSLAASFVVNGNNTFYFNGVNKGTAFFGTQPPTTTATSMINIGEAIVVAGRFTNATTLVAYAWNRALSDAEIAYLDRAPYSLLIPAANPLNIKTPIAVTIKPFPPFQLRAA